MKSRWDDEAEWNEFDYWCNLKATNPLWRGWLLLAAVLVGLVGIAAVVAKCWLL